MSTYKVIQDVEAEDKILGPLTLKQFIFAIITVALCFIAFFLGSSNLLLAFPWMLPILFFGFMASPIGKDQPNDVWLAARLRFLIKPRKRVWDQAGMQELVTINVPKKVEVSRTDGLSQGEVKSRLSALSNLMDSRGWAIKDVSMPALDSITSSNVNADNRLIAIPSYGIGLQPNEVKPGDDILDYINNTVAGRIDSAIKQKQNEKISKLKTQMINDALLHKDADKLTNGPIEDNNLHIEPGYLKLGSRVFLPESSDTNGASLVVDTQEISDAEQKKFLDKINKQQQIKNAAQKSSHEHRIEPINNNPESSSTGRIKEESLNMQNDIISQLGQSNDLSVDTIAKLAKHVEAEASLKDNDIISLH